MKKGIVGFVLISILFSAYLYFENPCYFISSQRDKLMCLFDNNKYDDVEEYFKVLQREYVDGIVTEDNVWNAFIFFETSNLSIKTHLERWLQQYPNSFSANQALGTLNEHLGWLSRGTKWSKDTKKGHMIEMGSFFTVAEKYFLKAIKNNDQTTLPYVGLIRMYKASDKNMMRSLMLKGLEIDPASYYIRYYYLFGLQPKWGGSIEELQYFFEETLSYSNDNSKLKSLEGFLYFILGDVNSYNDKDVKNHVVACKASKSNFDRAISLSENALFYGRRGDNNICLKEYEGAISDFTLALRLKPESVEYHKRRGSAYLKSGNHQMALMDLDWVISRDPLNPDALKYRARLFSEKKHTKKALRDFEASLYFDRDNEIVYRDMGNLHYFQTKNYKKSIEYLNKAIELGDDDPLVYFLLSMSQYEVFDCGFISSTKKYLNRCKTSTSCKDDHFRWVKQATDAVGSSGMCK